MQNHSSGDSGDREEEDCSGDSIALGIVCSGDGIALGIVSSSPISWVPGPRPPAPLRRQRFSVAFRPQKPYGLLGTGKWGEIGE